MWRIYIFLASMIFCSHTAFANKTRYTLLPGASMTGRMELTPRFAVDVTAFRFECKDFGCAGYGIAAGKVLSDPKESYLSLKLGLLGIFALQMEAAVHFHEGNSRGSRLSGVAGLGFIMGMISFGVDAKTQKNYAEIGLATQLPLFLVSEKFAI